MTVERTSLQPRRTDLEPTTAALHAALTAAGRRQGWLTGPLVITSRTTMAEGSFFAVDILGCSVGSTDLRIVAKYGRPQTGGDVELHRAHGHRRGVAYESMVYREILAAAAATTPRFFGSCESETGETWLFVEHLEGAARLTTVDGGDTASFSAVGAWLGQFHGAWAGRVDRSRVVEYTADYWNGWVDRAVAFAEPHLDRYPWAPQLPDALAQWAIDMSSHPATIIHGEFYPDNVLLVDGTVVPVDWESAAFGPPEVDLAAATEGWPTAAISACERSYRSALGKPLDDQFDRRIESSRLYWDLRWLGDRPDWTRIEKILRRIERVRTRAERLGYLS